VISRWPLQSDASRCKLLAQFSNRLLYSYEKGLLSFSITFEGRVATFVQVQAEGFKPVLRDGTQVQHPEH
jgi:hypothetical protein